MAKIQKIQLQLVNLDPKVKRTDAIQSFVTQETPIVSIIDEDGQEINSLPIKEPTIGNSALTTADGSPLYPTELAFKIPEISFADNNLYLEIHFYNILVYSLVLILVHILIFYQLFSYQYQNNN